MNFFLRSCFSAILLFLFVGIANASTATVPTPVGSWQTIDDVTNTPRSIVKISQTADQELTGIIVKINYRPNEGPNDVCSKCSGDLHNQKILGLTVLSGMKQNKDNPLQWNDGHILDPENGNKYRCLINISPDGKTVKVRGYIGFSWIGRTQTWYRVS